MSPAIELGKIRNLTSGRDIFVGKNDRMSEVVEYDDHSIVCLVPKLKAGVGNLISLSGHIRILDEAAHFEATGKIISVGEEPEEELVRIQIHLSQVDRDLWNRFLKAAASAQAHVDHLFTVMKGEEL